MEVPLMAPIVIPSTLRIRLIWQLNSQDWAQNVLHASIGAGPAVDQAMADTIASHAGGAHTSSGLAVLQPTSVTLDRVIIRDLRQANRAPIPSAIGSAGTATGNLLPLGVGLVCTLRTALAGKSFTGRSYIPGFSEDANEALGVASPAAQAAAQAFIGDLNTSMTGSGWPLGVASLKFLEINLLTAAEVRDGKWDGQSSRRDV